MNDKQVLQDVAFNPAAKCSPTATQCPRCNNPHNACDKDAQPAGKDAWLVEAERLAQLHACEKSLRHLGREDADETKTLAALLAHLRSHPAEAQLEAARKDVEKLRALYRAMREPMAMIGMDKHIGPFSDEAIALLDAMNALDGGTYSKKVAGEAS